MIVGYLFPIEGNGDTRPKADVGRDEMIPVDQCRRCGMLTIADGWHRCPVTA